MPRGSVSVERMRNLERRVQKLGMNPNEPSHSHGRNSRASSVQPPDGRHSRASSHAPSEVGSHVSRGHTPATEKKPKKKKPKQQNKNHAPQAKRIESFKSFAPVQLPLPHLNSNRVEMMMDAYNHYYKVVDRTSKTPAGQMFAYQKGTTNGRRPVTIVAQKIVAEKNTYFKPEDNTYAERKYYKFAQSKESTFLLYTGVTDDATGEQKQKFKTIFDDEIDGLKPLFERTQVPGDTGEMERDIVPVTCFLYCCMPLTARDGDKNASIFVSIIVPCEVPKLEAGEMNLRDNNMLGIVQSESLGEPGIASSRNSFLTKYSKYILSTNWDHDSKVPETEIRQLDEKFASIFDSMYMVKRIDKSTGCVKVIQHTYKVGERLGRLPQESAAAYTLCTQFVFPTHGMAPESINVMQATLLNMLDYMRALVRNKRYRKAIVATEVDNNKKIADSNTPQVEKTELQKLFQKTQLADFVLTANADVTSSPHWNIQKSTHYLTALYAVHSLACSTLIMSHTIDKKRYQELNDTKVTWRGFFEENGVYANRRIEMETRTETEHPLKRVPLRDEFENDDTTDEEDAHADK